jgi:hypothetical protein
MSILDETQFVERLRFFNGQLLTAPDLQGIDDFNREMRWLHNASLHQPGIGSGFAVSGNKGDRQITVAPGYALDDLGREIVLTHDYVKQIPPVAGDGNGGSVFYCLTVSYPDDASLEPAETREMICDPSQAGVVRLSEIPVFCWVELSSDTKLAVDPDEKAAILSHRKIVLAQIEILNCQLKQPVTTTCRCNARPDCGSRIYCGRQRLAKLSAATEDNLNDNLRFSIYEPIKISTVEGAFLALPHYSVNVEGNRLLTISSGNEVLGLEQLQIQEQTKTSIVVRLVVFWLNLTQRRVAETSRLQQRDLRRAAIERDWKIMWMGVES